MGTDTEPLVDIAFEAEIIHWRGPSPYVFLGIPSDHVGEIRHAAREASYGWGVVPVEATIGGISFTTSLFPKDDGYLLPLKVAVRKAADIGPGDIVAVALRVHGRRSG